MKQTVILKQSRITSGLRDKVHIAYLLLGSNIGDRMYWLQFGTKACSTEIGMVLSTSSIYETEPWGKLNQAAFLNQVLKVKTDLEPLRLLIVIAGIEEQAERQRKELWGPRTLDIDILLYDDLVIDSEKLTLPHPQLHKRNFALVPLAEIAPELQHPVFGITIRELATHSDDHSEVSILPD